MTNDIKEAALYWAKQGYPVFPCKPENKSPLVRDGFKAATTDPQLIEQWWSQFPNAMIGMPTGAASGITVVDVDVHGEVNGMPWFEEHRADFADAPIVKTPSGGLHIYFIADGTKNSASKIARGVDTRGDGGYVCVPPSVTTEGTYYGWHNPIDLFPPRRMPAWVAEKLVAKEPAPAPADNIAAAPDNRTIPADLPIMAMLTSHDRYAQQALENECRQLATCPQGGRNHALNRAAFSLGTLVGAGVLDRDVVIGRLFAAAASCGLVNADGRDSVLATISSGLKGGIAQPRQLDTPTQPVTLPQSSPIASQEPTGSPVDGPKPFDLPKIGFCNFLAIPHRQWLYGRSYIREFATLTVAPGGVGKSALTLVEAVAMASGRKLLGDEPKGKLNVLVYNLEDPLDDMKRRLDAVMVAYNIAPSEIHDTLCLISGRDQELILADYGPDGKTVQPTQTYHDLKAAIIRGKYDVAIFDPLVNTSWLNENDNKEMNSLVKLLTKLASETKCAIHLVHHTRKMASGESHSAGNADAARGASSILGAVRAARTLTKMTEDEAEKLGLPRDKNGWYVRMDDAKANLLPPADGTTWYQHENVTISNGEDVGTLKRWTPPSLFDCMSATQKDAILAELRQGPEPGEKYALKKNGNSGRWAGHIIMDITNCNEKQAAAILTSWAQSGAITERKYEIGRRRPLGVFVNH